MIKIAICDDEADTRACLSSLIRAQPCPCEIAEYASADDYLADHREIDLFFLDIELTPDRPDGMALARKIRERTLGTQPAIVFVTGCDRYALDAFDVARNEAHMPGCTLGMSPSVRTETSTTPVPPAEAGYPILKAATPAMNGAGGICAWPATLNS